MKLDEKAVCKVIRDFHDFEGTVERREPFFLTALYNAVVSPDVVHTGRNRLSDAHSGFERHYGSDDYARLERRLLGAGR